MRSTKFQGEKRRVDEADEDLALLTGCTLLRKRRNGTDADPLSQSKTVLNTVKMGINECLAGFASKFWVKWRPYSILMPLFMDYRPLVLGSSSRYRKALLERLQLPFDCCSPDVDETPLAQESATALVGRLAR